ncbi:hypothetical protein CI238_03467 [Colletotrichum incanum]|uniref:Uncharacterized protein n=1 Tax=Colletotrichum incanum TaxID=1573173 RepID=A0A166Z1W8_COLIC|nr:hypothetical protein CI238_03467 [Colletotrichum incanum]
MPIPLILSLSAVSVRRRAGGSKVFRFPSAHRLFSNASGWDIDDNPPRPERRESEADATKVSWPRVRHASIPASVVRFE